MDNIKITASATPKMEIQSIKINESTIPIQDYKIITSGNGITEVTIKFYSDFTTLCLEAEI